MCVCVYICTNIDTYTYIKQQTFPFQDRDLIQFILFLVVHKTQFIT